MTKQKNQPRWTAKGNFGYFRSEKKRRTLVTAALFAGPLIVLISAWIYYKTRLNVWTVLAVVSSLPGCRSLVNLIMLLRCRSMDPELYQEIHDHQGNLTMAYEMYMTFYEKSAYVDAFAVCGNSVSNAFGSFFTSCTFGSSSLSRSFSMVSSAASFPLSSTVILRFCVSPV